MPQQLLYLKKKNLSLSTRNNNDKTAVNELTLKQIISLLCFSVLLVVIGCSSKPAQLQEFSADRFYMDTLVRITVYCGDAEKGKEALDSAFAAFAGVDDLTNRFAKAGKTENDVQLINKYAGVKPVKVNADMLEIVSRANYFSGLCNGSFDVSIGPVMDLWGFGQSEQKVPRDEDIAAALKLVNYRKVIVDAKNSSIFLADTGMSMDLGGVAKGYATEKAAKVLKGLNIQHAMINAGGNVYALGTKPDGSPWRIGVRDPRNDQGVIAVIYVQDKAVVTSGDYERFFEKGGVRYHHILDPATGKQAGSVMQTTIVADSATDADILSTTLFVLGPERGMDFVQGQQGTGALIVGTDKQVTMTDNLSGLLEFTGDGGYQLPEK